MITSCQNECHQSVSHTYTHIRSHPLKRLKVAVTWTRFNVLQLPVEKISLALLTALSHVVVIVGYLTQFLFPALSPLSDFIIEDVKANNLNHHLSFQQENKPYDIVQDKVVYTEVFLFCFFPIFIFLFGRKTTGGLQGQATIL